MAAICRVYGRKCGCPRMLILRGLARDAIFWLLAGGLHHSQVTNPHVLLLSLRNQISHFFRLPSLAIDKGRLASKRPLWSSVHVLHTSSFFILFSPVQARLPQGLGNLLNSSDGDRPIALCHRRGRGTDYD